MITTNLNTQKTQHICIEILSDFSYNLFVSLFKKAQEVVYQLVRIKVEFELKSNAWNFRYIECNQIKNPMSLNC